MKTRVFTRQELSHLELPEGDSEDVTVLHDEPVEKRRWSTLRALVFQTADDGCVWRVHWHEPATENQEDMDPWYDEAQVVAEEVSRYQVNTFVWLSEKEASVRSDITKVAGIR